MILYHYTHKLSIFIIAPYTSIKVGLVRRINGHILINLFTNNEFLSFVFSSFRIKALYSAWSLSFSLASS